MLAKEGWVHGGCACPARGPLRQETERGEEDAVEVDMGEARLVVNEPRSKARFPRTTGGFCCMGCCLLLCQSAAFTWNPAPCPG